MKLPKTMKPSSYFYSVQSPFSAIQAPKALFMLILKKDWPASGGDLLWTFIIYLAVIVVLSLPFVIFDWPSGGRWSEWPF